jgi:hypothetical protein
MDQEDPNDFEKLAAAHGSPGVLREFFGFLRQNKKWWLLPVLLALILFWRAVAPEQQRAGAVHLPPVLKAAVAKDGSG